ncbi:MAG TPA: putative Ig domain-containing protein [Candidatus Eisenbacteria bacterium]
MSPGRSSRTLRVLACALLLCGCSAPTSKQSAVDRGRPRSSGLRLSPSPAFAASRIDAIFEDPWIDPAKCWIVWKRNGSVIRGARTASLAPSFFSRGQRISIEVTVEDPAGGAARELVAAVDVVNTPPKITGVSLSMNMASGTAEIDANVDSADPDGDRVSYEYGWFKNDRPFGAGAGPALAAGDLARGDRVAVEVVASDGQSTSPPVRSDALVIENFPPQFTSQPVAPRSNDEAFRYQATAVDRDGDPLRYELVSAPDGMTLQPDGLIVWPLPAQDQRKGEYPVRLKVTDPNGGASIQEFSIPLAPPGHNP